MKACVPIALAALLASCGENHPMPSEQMAKRFAEAGVVPECARMEWAIQLDQQDRFVSSARYLADDTCMDEWDASLRAAGFDPQIPHGELLNGQEPPIMVTSPYGGARVVNIYTSTEIAGVPMHVAEEL